VNRKTNLTFELLNTLGSTHSLDVGCTAVMYNLMGSDVNWLWTE
jgi:hypothetical protein